MKAVSRVRQRARASINRVWTLGSAVGLVQLLKLGSAKVHHANSEPELEASVKLAYRFQTDSSSFRRPGSEPNRYGRYLYLASEPDLRQV